jgi:hypothetical protein
MRQRPSLIHRFARPGVIAAAALAVIAFFSLAGLAATPEDYQKRLAAAHDGLKQLQKLNWGAGPSAETEQRLLALIKSAVPRSEKLDWPGGAVETDNSWLYAGLEGYAEEVNLSKKAAVLVQLDDRLSAVSKKVAEIQAASAGDRTKDEDKRKLAEILRREEYQKPAEAGESLFQRWTREILEWLRKMFPKVDIKPPESSGVGSLSYFLQILLYVLLAVGIGYLVFRLLPLFADRFGKRTKRPKIDRVILGERIGDDQSSHDLFAEAERLARDGELRLAIRKGYIALLCELNDRKIIGLARHKTNRDYLRDLRPRRELFEQVRGLTASFERHWYGSEASAEQDWAEFRQLYNAAVRGV